MESSGILNVINNIFGDINGFLQNLIGLKTYFFSLQYLLILQIFYGPL